MAEGDVRIRFGGGRHTNKIPDEIDETECQDGENFILTPGSNLFKPRGPLKLVATATNAAEVRGYAQLEKQDGSLSTLIQAGSAVYEWDGASTFTIKGTVSASAKLRGKNPEHNFTLDEEVIITDLALVEDVAAWDGTTYAKMTTALSPDEFRAKYCTVDNERAIFANVQAPTGTNLPHVIVGSTRGDKNILSIADRPSSSLNEQDPWFIPIPDLNPINGLAAGFGLIAFSTRRKTHKLTGSSAKDFAIDPLHESSGVSGDESLINIGNDILIPRIGKIDTLVATDSFGDVLVDDLSLEIAGEIEDEKGWQTAYNPVTGRIYMIPDTANKCHVLNKFIIDQLGIAVRRRAEAKRISPWSKYTTDLSFGFSSPAMWTMKDPIDGIFKTYLGGPAGEIYQFDGEAGQDGGTVDISASRTSKRFSLPPAATFDVQGSVLYRRPAAPVQLTLTMESSGAKLASQTRSFMFQQLSLGDYFGGDIFWGGDWYFGAPSDTRPLRAQFTTGPQATDWAVKAQIDGSTDFAIEEIVLHFTAENKRASTKPQR